LQNVNVQHVEISKLTLAASDTVSQLPPERANFPLPMRAKISSGVSSGPLAKGVKLWDRMSAAECVKQLANVPFQRKGEKRKNKSNSPISRVIFSAHIWKSKIFFSNVL